MIIEKKVTAGATVAYLVGVAVLAVLNGVTDANLVAGLPDGWEIILAPLVPALASGVAGWLTRHTPRPDLRGPVV